MREKRVFHKTVCWVVSWCILFLSIFPSYGYAVSENSKPRPSFQAASNQLERYMDIIKRLRSQVDRSQFDVDALLEKLEFDEDNIINFVKNEVHFQQYSGVLRGPEGTLRSMSGNALDQAILLSSLLKNAGFDARILRTQVSAEQGKALLKEISLAGPAKSPYLDEGAFNSILREMWELTGQPASDFEAILDKASRSDPGLEQKYIDIVNRDAEFIFENLALKDIVLGNQEAPEEIATEARDYFWVEYRSGVSSGWSTVHPVLKRLIPAFESLESVQTISDTIPDDLLHKFRFEVVLEQQRAGKPVTQSLINPWEVPAANIAGKGMSFTNTPLSFIQQLDEGILNIGEESNDIFIPVFRGNPNSQTFDLLGNVVPLEAAASSYAAIFATDANKLAEAANSLNALGGKSKPSDKAVMYLSSLKIKLTLIEPGGTETSFWREIYTEPEENSLSEKEKRIELYSALTQNYSIVVGTGADSQAAIIDASLQAIEAKQGVIRSVLNQVYEKEGAGASMKQGEGDVNWLGSSVVFSVFDLFNRKVEFKTYRHKPSLFIHRSTLPLRTLPTAHTDILQNKRRPVSVSGEHSFAATQDMVRMGVWESLAEGLLIRKANNPVLDTHSIFEKHKADGSDFKVIQPSNSAAVSELHIGEAARTSLINDLKSGYTVIVPDSKGLNAANKIAWWRIDPLTGETLGIGETGEGTAITADLVLKKFVIFAVIGGAVGVGCVLIAGPINAQRPGTITGGDCVSAGVGAGVGAALGPTVDLIEIVSGFGIGFAASMLGKVVDAWGVLE